MVPTVDTTVTPTMEDTSLATSTTQLTMRLLRAASMGNITADTSITSAGHTSESATAREDLVAMTSLRHLVVEHQQRGGPDGETDSVGSSSIDDH